ncbi:hypothetical protein SESBI_37722 [Sesbania bispinosa]|nr:hypothetical protein SESBI_37722 [Sesbania bispinosa]
MPTPRASWRKLFSQVRDLEGDANSQSRLEKIVKPSPRLGRRCRLPEPAGENYLAKSETWKAMSRRCRLPEMAGENN